MGSSCGGSGFGVSEKCRKGAKFGKEGGRGEGEDEEEVVVGDELSSLLGGVEGRSKGGSFVGVGRERREKKPRRKVKWSDRYGEKLVEVVEFQPSDSSDSEGESLMDSCICSVM